jgi:cob(I)alamin adenosyltransferase
MKGWPDYGELVAVQHQPHITIVQFGGPDFVDRDDPDPRDVEQAQKALRYALDVLRAGHYDVLVLDEINVALDYSLVSLEQVMALLDAKPVPVELVLTGRGAHPAVIERADLVTEMRSVKHPYASGICARKGIEY